MDYPQARPRPDGSLADILVKVSKRRGRLVPRSAIKSRLRSIFAGTQRSMREELISERRADAARDADAGG